MEVNRLYELNNTIPYGDNILTSSGKDIGQPPSIKNELIFHTGSD